MTFDSSKPVQTRDGRPARIICTDAKYGDTARIVGLITQPNGDEFVAHYQSDGVWRNSGVTSHDDLINTPVTHEVVVTLHKNPLGDLYATMTKEIAGNYNPIASKRIVFTENEFED